jgi:hypothetical protein
MAHIELAEKAEVKKKKGASETPHVAVPDIDSELDQILDIERQMDDLKARLAECKASVAIVAEAELDAACRREGKMFGRIVLNDKMFYERANRPVDISDAKVIERLRAKFPKFDEFFAKKRKLSVPTELVIGEKADEILVKRLTDLGVAATFSYQPTAAYWTALALDPKFQEIATAPEGDGRASPAPGRQTCFKSAVQE